MPKNSATTRHCSATGSAGAVSIAAPGSFKKSENTDPSFVFERFSSDFSETAKRVLKYTMEPFWKKTPRRIQNDRSEFSNSPTIHNVIQKT